MQANLANLTVLVTKPESRGQKFCATLTSYGANVFHLPTIAFKALTETDNFIETIKQVDQADWLIFVSPQAVTETIKLIRERILTLSRVKFAAIGESTANLLQEEGIANVIYPPTNWNSEAFIALPEFQKVSGQRIMLVRGLGGRTLLQNELLDRGAFVTSLIAYERYLPMIDIAPYLNLLEKKQLDVVICTSYENISHLKKLVGNTGWQFIQKIPMIVVSERLKALAEDLGLETLWVAPNASDQALIELLVQKKDVLCQNKKTK